MNKFILVVIFFLSCNYKKKFDFNHTKKYDYDIFRLPLIEPLDLIGMDSDKRQAWNLNFPGNINLNLSDYCIDSINISKKIILFHSCDSRILYGSIDLGNKKIDKFLDYSNFYTFCVENNLNSSLKLPKTLFEYWNKTDSIIWNN